MAAEPINLELAPRPPSLASLYEIEDTLAALLDTEALVSPEQEEEFRLALETKFREAPAKRDRCAQFIKYCESQEALAKEEVARIRERAGVFTRARERMEGYLLRIVEQFAPEPKKGPKKLEGNNFTLVAHKCAASLDIDDPAKVPDRFKTVTVSMSVTDYIVLLASMQNADLRKRIDATAAYSIDNAAVKRALQANEEVPGADLLVGKTSLNIR